ncbi:radical SAM/SPASM domain-containing protein [Candidatus Omnitrophota bacterium]
MATKALTSKDKTSRHRSIAIEFSRRCNIKCPHCITGTNPRKKERFSYPQLSYYLRQTKTISKGVSFTGGEPFLYLDRLNFAVREATRLRLWKGVITNAFWADSQKKAERILDRINKSGGIDRINISTDIFHEQFVPFSNVINAINTCKKLKISADIRIFHVGFSKQAKHRAVSLIKKRLKSSGETDIEIHSQPLITFDGIKIDKRRLKIRYSSRLSAMNRCGALHTFFVTYDGDVYPCCFALAQAKYQKAVVLGNINERPLKDIVDEAQSSFLPNFLVKFGPQGLVKLIREKKGRDLARSLMHNIQTNDICHLCVRLFSSLEAISLIGTMRNKTGE